MPKSLRNSFGANDRKCSFTQCRGDLEALGQLGIVALESRSPRFHSWLQLCECEQSSFLQVSDYSSVNWGQKNLVVNQPGVNFHRLSISYPPTSTHVISFPLLIRWANYRSPNHAFNLSLTRGPLKKFSPTFPTPSIFHSLLDHSPLQKSHYHFSHLKRTLPAFHFHLQLLPTFSAPFCNKIP